MIEKYAKQFILGCLVAGTMSLSAQEKTATPEKAEPAVGETKPTTEATPATAVQEKVVVTGQIIPENGHELVGTNVRISGEEIRRHGYADINQVLRKIPGVYVREEDGYGLFPNISMRGVDPTRNNKISVMEDGILTSPAPYSAPSAYYTPNAARMSDIEVFKGGSQIKFGPSNTAGVLNYVSTPVPAEETFYFKQTFGSDNEKRTHVYYGDAIEMEGGTLSYLLEGFYRENDGFKNIQGVDSTTGINEQVEPMLKLRWEPDTAQYQYFELKVGYSDLEADETYLGLNDQDFKDDPYDRYWGSQWDQINSQQTRTYLKHFIELDSDTSFSTTAYYNKFHRNWHKLHDVNYGAGNTSLSQAMNEAGGIALLKGQGVAGDTLRVRNNNRDYYSYGIQNELVHEFETGDIGHELTLGTRWHVDEIRREQWNETYDHTGALTAVGAKGTAGDRRQKTYAASVYVQDKVQLTDKLSVTAGVRSEYINYHHNRYDNGTKGTAQHSPWTGGVGFTYELTDSVDLFGGVHRGMTAPSPRGNIASGVGFERSNAYELGARYTNEKHFLKLESALFRTDFDNLIVPENIATGNDSDENAGEVRSQGVELVLNGMQEMQIT